MSLLPQRKKSPEEIAKLRETLGIPGAAAETQHTFEPAAPPAAPAPPSAHLETLVPAIHEAAVVEDGDPLSLQTEPAAPATGPKPVHSLKRSERMPAPSAAPVLTAAAAVTHGARPVRSLRKSEHLPPAAPHPESPPDSRLPHQRHSDREIEEIRRREVLAMMNAAPNPRLFPAHPAIIIPGYVFPPAAAAGIWFYQFPIAATAGFAIVSLAIAGVILWRKPISRHHAAFIAVLALFLIVFSALYYFPNSGMPRKDLLDIESLDRSEIDHLLDQSVPFKEVFTRSVKKFPALKGKSVLMLFYEPSTRTHSSFEVAAKRLSADVTNFDVAQSSITKGESVRETIETLQAMRTDYVIVRHKASGLPGTIARLTKASVINAGDGAHAHPTQALLDAFTIKEKFPDPAGRKVLITGDVLHSRVARSTSTILKKLGLEVAYLGPGSLVPRTGPENIRRFTDYKEAMAWNPDIIYLLRVQMERQDVQFFPSLREYHKLYGITEHRLEEIRKRGVYIMHPGPVNRGVELCDAVMDYERSLINDQVENGIAVRMAVLYWLKPSLA